jgi:NADH-quinone oxidoreductase subunit N
MNAIIVAALWGVLMMYAGFVAKGRSTNLLAIAGILVLIVVNWLEYLGLPFFSIDTKGMLVYNTFGLLFNEVMLVATLVYFLLSGQELGKSNRTPSDLYALLFFILAGIAIIAGFRSLLMLFIGIEIVSIPLYVLAGSAKANLKSNEAALKYFLMGSFSTGIMLMGIAFLYGDAGTFFLEGINAGIGVITPMKGIGMVLLLTSMSFKVSAVPFHFWTPDVYDGSPTVFTSFMATIVKSAGFFAFIKLFESAFGSIQNDWQGLMALIAALTLIIGNVTAVFQQSVKRMLSYSSIAQAGFMLLGVFALNVFAKQGMILYFAAYSFATIAIFAVLAKLKDDSIDSFNGFARKQPVVALALLISFLSLAGIPLTAGFFAKYFMLLAVIKDASMLWLLVIAILCAAVSVYYYFRVIQAMYFKEGSIDDENQSPVFSAAFKVIMVMNSILILILGIHPDWLTNLL